MPSHIVKGLSLSLLSIFISGCGGDPDSAMPLTPVVHPVKMMTLGTFEDENARVFPGIVISKDQTTLSFRVPGQLELVSVLSGQEVKRGDILATLDPIDYELNLAKGKATYKLAKVEYDRSARLAEEQLIAEAELDRDRSRARTAEVAVEQLEANVGYTQLRAPYDGIISRVHIENHEYVAAKQPIMNLQSKEFVEVQFQATENIISRLTRGHTETVKPRVRFSQFGDELYESNFSEIDTQADPNTLSYSITLILEKPEGMELFSGMSADVLFYASDFVENATTSFAVPMAALTTDNVTPNSQSSVWVFNQETSRASERQVQIGVIRGQQVQVLSGLNAGEKLILSGISMLEEGLEVTEWTRERGL